jgi:hypothetical protein
MRREREPRRKQQNSVVSAVRQMNLTRCCEVAPLGFARFETAGCLSWALSPALCDKIDSES